MYPLSCCVNVSALGKDVMIFSIKKNVVDPPYIFPVLTLVSVFWGRLLLAGGNLPPRTTGRDVFSQRQSALLKHISILYSN